MAVARLALCDIASYLRNLTNRGSGGVPCSPTKILLVNPAHLGDVVISTAILRKLTELFPLARFGFLAGSWCKPVLNDHPGLNATHYVDHWMLSRECRSIEEKKNKYLTDCEQARGDIANESYDVCLLLYAYEPSFIPFLKTFENLPLIGFNSAGYGPDLDLSYCYSAGDRHEILEQAKLLRTWSGCDQVIGGFKPWLKGQDESSIDCLRIAGIEHKNYIVVHPGTGSKHKEWPANYWVKLVNLILDSGHEVVITGAGEREIEFAEELWTKTANRARNLAGKATFQQFTGIVAMAKLVIGVDSLVGHIASGFDVNTLVISSGIANINHWRPLSANATVLSVEVDCSPCHSRPCKERRCLTGISPERVIFEVNKVLAARDDTAKANCI